MRVKFYVIMTTLISLIEKFGDADKTKTNCKSRRQLNLTLIDFKALKSTNKNITRESVLLGIIPIKEESLLSVSDPNSNTGLPTEITIQLNIINFDVPNLAAGMEFSVTMFLRRTWNDHRLMYRKLPDSDFIELDVQLQKRIWKPDIFFVNEKKAVTSSENVPNSMMFLYPNGDILFSARMSLILGCNMHLEKFPMDKQMCSIIMESYVHSTRHVMFRWHKENPVIWRDDIPLPQFTLFNHTHGDCTHRYTMGNFTCIRTNFNLARNYGFHVIQVYVPSVLIVILSWVSFWLDIHAVPGRISLGLLTVLTLTAQSAGARANLPQASYLKAIDVWMGACLLFVFAALIEFAYVNVCARKERKQQPTAAEGTSSKSSDSDNGGPLKMLPHTAEGDKGRRIDLLARIMFPASFAMFNLIYWSAYTLWEPEIPVPYDF